MTYGLTRAQLAVLRYVAGYVEARGYAPKLSEIKAGCGICSQSVVHYRLKALEERGYIRRLYGQPRAIEIVVAPPIPRGPSGVPLHFVGVAA